MRFHLSDDQLRLRDEARAFVEERRASFRPRCDGWLRGFDRGLSRALGERGWIGVSWPAPWGGGRSLVDRLVLTEVLLGAGAPLGAHWFADRQVGPSIVAFGTEAQKRRFLPEIRAGAVTYAIGLSEPEAGSDLAAVSTRATPSCGAGASAGASSGPVWPTALTTCTCWPEPTAPANGTQGCRS